jgi:micrococcal nuclease
MTHPVAILTILLFTCTYTCDPGSVDAAGVMNQDTLTGRVIKIIDGDTYDLLTKDTVQYRVRMEGIDAPEGGMPFYRVSKNYLGELCFDQQVTVLVNGKDRYDRILGYSYLEDGRELSREMLRAGLAWHFKRYNQDPALDSLEIEARNRKVGLWGDKDPKAPWDYRSEKRNQNNQKKQ